MVIRTEMGCRNGFAGCSRNQDAQGDITGYVQAGDAARRSSRREEPRTQART